MRGRVSGRAREMEGQQVWRAGNGRQWHCGRGRWSVPSAMQWCQQVIHRCSIRQGKRGRGGGSASGRRQQAGAAAAAAAHLGKQRGLKVGLLQDLRLLPACVGWRGRQTREAGAVLREPRWIAAPRRLPGRQQRPMQPLQLTRGAAEGDAGGGGALGGSHGGAARRWTAAVAGGGLLPVAGLAGCRWAGSKEGMVRRAAERGALCPCGGPALWSGDVAQRIAVCRRPCCSVPLPNTFADPCCSTVQAVVALLTACSMWLWAAGRYCIVPWGRRQHFCLRRAPRQRAKAFPHTIECAKPVLLQNKGWFRQLQNERCSVGGGDTQQSW